MNCKHALENRYFRLSTVLFMLTSVFYVPMLCASQSQLPDLSETLLTRTLAKTPIIDDLRELTGTIGGRPTGSPAMNKAVNWGLAKFNASGLENVHTEKYSPPRNWLPNIETGEIILLNNKHQSIRIAAMPFSLSTPKEGLEADIYSVGNGDEKTFADAGEKIKGQWVLVNTPLMQSLEDMYNDVSAIFDRATKSKAAGVLWSANRSGRVLYRHTLTFNGSMASLPAAIIEREEGERIARLLKDEQKLKAKLIIQNEVQEKPINQNVIAEITGWEIPDEVIVLGAHLDSWDLGEGALDNGSNSVLVIDAARQMMALANEGYRPRRTIRFILYSGEELGLYGSWFDVQNHREQLDKIKAVLIYDLGTGRTTGFSLGGRHDMTIHIEQALRPVSSVFGPFIQTFDASMDTDNFDYMIEGIPTLVANQDEKPYLASYHAETDTFDKVDKRELKRNTAIASVLIWSLANNEQALAPRQNHSEVMALLKDTGLDNDMKDNLIWSDFIEGRRGRQA